MHPFAYVSSTGRFGTQRKALAMTVFAVRVRVLSCGLPNNTPNVCPMGLPDVPARCTPGRPRGSAKWATCYLAPIRSTSVIFRSHNRKNVVPFSFSFCLRGCIFRENLHSLRGRIMASYRALRRSLHCSSCDLLFWLFFKYRFSSLRLNPTCPNGPFINSDLFRGSGREAEGNRS